ncbi:MAG: hypothetical protein HY911_04585, partial [Desulfobacterales bacterium]|nr:hypothetical protein [Desulfobacterales bacterium]
MRIKHVLIILLLALVAATAGADMKMGPEGGSLNLPGVSSDGNDGIEVDGQVKAGSALMARSRLTAITIANLPASGQSVGDSYLVSDATDSSDCTVGGADPGVP